MLDKRGSQVPYKPLGKELKALRMGVNETLAEASGAVEIDVRDLASFELGHSRPSEDVLLLLLSHFEVKEEDIAKLWDLAGYNTNKNSSIHLTGASLRNDVSAKDDGQIMFTDIVDVIVNNYGVVMNFMQNNGSKSQPSVVAKVGMSREHAKSVLRILQLTLSQTEKTRPKFTSPDNSADDSSTRSSVG